ncbi:MAG TPA: phosphoenolpyruvate--protein phosphotransferase [Gemmataceae bacterium]|nr:phosphoenolpyruvate--protein phosphotransferase [Gemmataceae bacterium]
MQRGLPLSPGVAVARAYRLDRRPAPGGNQHLNDDAVPAEVARFDAACAAAVRYLDDSIARVTGQLGEDEAEILRAHRRLLLDPGLLDKVRSVIRDRRLSAPAALHQVLDEYAALFGQSRDAYLRERLTDLRDVIGRIRRRLDNPAGPPGGLPTEPVVLVAPEIQPSQVLLATRLSLAGILTESGGPTGHAAILARSLGVPAVSGLAGLLDRVQNGDVVALDGLDGFVYVNPAPEVEAAYRKLQEQYANERDRLFANAAQEPLTADGVRVELLANANGAADAAMACRVGASGVGLYRTEYLFLTQADLPSEDEQFAVFREVVEAAPHRAVAVRTVDLGSDKRVPYLGGRHEDNPALGWRGIRLTGDHPAFFQAHLRAILRAGAFGNVEVLFPMVSTLEEVRRLRGLVDEARASLAGRGVPFAERMPVGVMLEVPAAAACIEDLLGAVDFVSVGSNDLIQYLMAADRNNPKVAALCEPFAPALYRVLNRILRACTEGGKPVTVCGEMAGRPQCLLPLLGMGLRRFSMSPAFVPPIKELVRRTTLAIARECAEQVLRLKTSGEVREYLTRMAQEVCPEAARVET